ncbi:hypothetical protein Y032_0391g566 [Ancylostoma ceylanicum]|nr:hypothetical protein Y032_0391g566 [Ancylostoma ceylanicum]
MRGGQSEYDDYRTSDYYDGTSEYDEYDRQDDRNTDDYDLRGSLSNIRSDRNMRHPDDEYYDEGSDSRTAEGNYGEEEEEEDEPYNSRRYYPSRYEDQARRAFYSTKDIARRRATSRPRQSLPRGSEYPRPFDTTTRKASSQNAAESSRKTKCLEALLLTALAPPTRSALLRPNLHHGNFEGGGDDDSALSASGMSMCSNLHKVFVKMREEDGCTGAVAFVDVICNDYDQCIVSENKSHDECQPKICQKFKEMPKKDCFKELFFCD